MNFKNLNDFFKKTQKYKIYNKILINVTKLKFKFSLHPKMDNIYKN